MKQVAWSHSALTSFETCPRRHYLTRISKEVPDPPSEAMNWGREVHQALENRLKGKGLPERFKEYEKYAAVVVKRSVGGVLSAEQKVALDRNFNAVAYFAPTVWVRSVADFTIHKDRHLFVGDWKTGKPKPDSDQLRLSAAIAFAERPGVEKVTTAFIWLNTGEVTSQSFTKSDAADIWQDFIPRVKRLEQAIVDKNFPPRPSGLCRSWCPVPSSKCEFRGT